MSHPNPNTYAVVNNFTVVAFRKPSVGASGAHISRDSSFRDSGTDLSRAHARTSRAKWGTKMGRATCASVDNKIENHALATPSSVTVQARRLSAAVGCAPMLAKGHVHKHASMAGNATHGIGVLVGHHALCSS